MGSSGSAPGLPLCQSPLRPASHPGHWASISGRSCLAPRPGLHWAASCHGPRLSGTPPATHSVLPSPLSLWAVRVSSYGQFWCLSLSVALCLPLYSVHCKWLLHRSLQLILFSVRPRPPASTKSSSSIFF